MVLPKAVIAKLKGAKAYQAYRLNILINSLYLGRHEPILIWQMGKVGSTSIASSLRQAGIRPIFNFHSLENPGSYFFPNFGRSPIFIRDRLLKKSPVKIITLVREPIGRNISSFFQRFRGYTGLSWEKAENFTVSDLHFLFMKNFYHQEPLFWFDDNFKKHLNLDIYQYHFPRERGFSIINSDNIKLLTIKAELGNSQKEKIIAEFLKIKSFSINNTNTSNNKIYAVAYKSFVEKLKLALSYLKLMENSQYFNHFYTKSEIKTVISRWQKRLDS